MFHKSLLLTGLAVLPTLSSVPVSTNTSQEVKVKESESEQEESCTFMYVGKNVSENGKALVARCGDSAPASMNMHTKLFAHNQLANVVVHGKNGFSWKMPSTTYKYIATPRNPAIKNGLHWEVSAVNEKGVAVSATLTCNTNYLAKAADPFIENGLSEDNIAQIVGATADTARHGIDTLINIIKTIGNGENNAIMIMDKDEVWYMEMYTGHEYIAIRMPDNYACTIGNEFMLDTIDELINTFGISSDNIIASDNLLKLAVDNGFAKFEGTPEDLQHLHLYNTYAGHGETSGQGNFVNGCHMRTWRGRDLFATEKASYTIDMTTAIPQTKYKPFWTPVNKLKIDDVITFMRDRFENILEGPHDDKAAFEKALEVDKRLRVVGTGSTYQVHVMYVDADLPPEIAVTEWMALSSANYTPFVPINNGIDRLIDYYTYVAPKYGVDEKAACCIFKKLNNLADTNRTNFGKPIQSFITTHEDIWQTQYADIMGDIKTLSLKTQKDVLTNFSCWLQMLAIEMSKMLYDDLMCRIANPPSPTLEQQFQPLICPEYYGYIYGWDCSTNNNIVTLKQNDHTITLDCNYSDVPKTGWINGKLTVDGELKNSKVRSRVKDGICFMDYETAKTYISDGHDLRNLDYKEFISASNNNNSSWVIPVAITVPIVVLVAGVAPVMAFTSSRKKKQIATKQ